MNTISSAATALTALTAATAATEITGAEILVRCLAEEGVEHVFGYPGGAVLYIYDAIFNLDFAAQTITFNGNDTLV